MSAETEPSGGAGSVGAGLDTAASDEGDTTGVAAGGGAGELISVAAGDGPARQAARATTLTASLTQGRRRVDMGASVAPDDLSSMGMVAGSMG